MEMVRETSKNRKPCFSLLIYGADIKNIKDKKLVNWHLFSYIAGLLDRFNKSYKDFSDRLPHSRRFQSDLISTFFASNRFNSI